MSGECQKLDAVPSIMCGPHQYAKDDRNELAAKHRTVRSKRGDDRVVRKRSVWWLRLASGSSASARHEVSGGAVSMLTTTLHGRRRAGVSLSRPHDYGDSLRPDLHRVAARLIQSCVRRSEGGCQESGRENLARQLHELRPRLLRSRDRAGGMRRESLRC